MSIETITAPQEISSWNEHIFAFEFDEEHVALDALDANIETALTAGFGDPLDPSDPCSQFSCSAYWPLS